MDLGIAELIKKQNLDLLNKYSQYIEEIYNIKLDRDFQKFFNHEPKSITKSISKSISNTHTNKKKKKIIRKKKEDYNIKTIETFPEDLNPLDNPKDNPKDKSIKKKKIIRKPAKVKSIYEKFVDYCLKHDIKYFKYKNNFNWIGPAFIIDKDNQVSLDDIRQETQIKLNYEQFALSNYIVYPKQLDDYTKLNYPITMPNYNNCKDSSFDNENVQDEDYNEDETVVIEWNYKGNMYYCQEDTGDVYNQNEEYIGKRAVKNGNYILNLSCY